MKYDFSTYLTQALNEADNDDKKKVKVFETDDSAKTKTFTSTDQDSVEDWIDKNYKNIKLKNDNLIYTSPEDNVEYTLKSKFDIKKMYNEIKEASGDKAKALDKDGFEKLGRTIAYRSALTVWNMINNSGDDFKQAALDVFKDNSEYSIKQLENLDSLLDYSAAIGVVQDKKTRLDKDKNDANYESLLKKCNDAEAKLTTKDNYSTIQQIKKDYEKEFNDKRDVYEKAFNDGMAEQKKKMAEKDYKWEDPATGQPPKGKLAKTNQAADAIFKSIQSGVEKADEFAKKQQGLDKALLTLAVMGVKGMMFGGKMLKKLINGIFKHTNIKGALRHSAKFNDVVKKIDIFKKEYDEYKKNGGGESGKDDKEKTDEQKKADDDKKKTILMKFAELMNTHLIPYYYCKLSFIVASVENLEGKYIIKQENNLWNTLNSSTGRVTIIEDNAILIKRLLDVVDKKLSDPLKEFGNEPCKDAFKSIPTDFTFKKNYLDNFLKWVDRIKDVKMQKMDIQRNGFKKEKLKNLDKIYNEAVIKNKFNSYQEFLTYIQTVIKNVEQCDLPVAYNLKFTFDGDEDAGVPGVITGAKKETEKQEENNGIDKEQINKDYKEISAALDELKNVNELNKVNDKFDTINSKVNDTVDQLKGVVNKDTESDEAKKKKLEDLLMAKTTIDKVIAIKAVMNNYNLTESVAMNEIIKLLNEDAEAQTPDIGKIKEEISDIIGGDITLDNASEYTKKSKDVYDKITALYNAQNDDTKKKLEEYKDKPLQLLYSFGAINGEKKNEPAPVDSNQTQDAINKTKQAIETAEDTDTIFNDEYYNDLKGELKGVYSTIDEMTKNNDELLQEFLNIEIDDDIKDELLPQLWHYKRFLTILFEKQKEAKKNQEEGKKESYNPFYAHDMLVLLEAETEENKDNNNVVEALKAKTKAIKEILAQKDMAEFNKAYKVWKDEINKLLEKFDKIENKDKLTDPLQKLSAMGNYIKNKPEEKKEENPKPAEEGGKSEESEKSAEAQKS